DTLSAPAPAKPAAPAGADAGAETTQTTETTETTVPASSAPDRTRAEDGTAPGAPSAEAPFDQETAPETGVVEEPPSARTARPTAAPRRRRSPGPSSPRRRRSRSRRTR